MLKKHTDINSHASCITLIVRETELLSFVTVFFQTAPGFFCCVDFSFLFFLFIFFLFFHNVNGYSHVTHCKFFCGNYGNMDLFIGAVWKDPGLSDLPDIVFLKHRIKPGKETAQDRSGVPEELSGQVRNHKCR